MCCTARHARLGRAPVVIQRQLGHANLSTTSIYLQRIDPDEIIAAVRTRRAPMIPPAPVSASERSRQREHHPALPRRRAEPSALATARTRPVLVRSEHVVDGEGGYRSSRRNGCRVLLSARIGCAPRIARFALRNRSRCGATAPAEVLNLSGARGDRNAEPLRLRRTSGPLVSVAGCRRGPGTARLRARKRYGRVTFTVTDAADPVRGATVRAAGSRAGRTDIGRVRLRFREARRERPPVGTPVRRCGSDDHCGSAPETVGGRLQANRPVTR